MAEIKAFETKEQRINQRIDALFKEHDEKWDEYEVAFNRFNMIIDNGGQLTIDDVKAVFKPLVEMDNIHCEIEENMRKKGIDIETKSLNDLAVEAFWEEKIEEHKKKASNDVANT